MKTTISFLCQPLFVRCIQINLCASASLRLCVFLGATSLIWVLFSARVARAEVTAEQVNAAINSGVAFLEKQQRPDGRWTDHESEPGGATALCTLALLNCGRQPTDPSVKRALDYLERLPDPERTYSSSL